MGCKLGIYRLIGLCLAYLMVWTPTYGTMLGQGSGTLLESSPFDPKLPVIPYIPVSIIDQAHKEAKTQGISFEQALLAHSSEFGVFPHLPTLPGSQASGLKVLDLSVRWAKSFHSGLFDGHYYIGLKGKIMSQLHSQHTNIIKGLQSLTKAFEANPQAKLSEFGHFNGDTFVPGDSTTLSKLKIKDPNHPNTYMRADTLLANTLGHIKKSHDLIESLLGLPPASIDPDLIMENWLDSTGIGSNYAQTHRPNTLKGTEPIVKSHLKTYCATKYIPWLLQQNFKRGLLKDAVTIPETTHLILMSLLNKDALNLPIVAMGLKPNETSAPSLELDSLPLVTLPNPDGTDIPVLTLKNQPAMTDTQEDKPNSTNLAGLLLKETIQNLPDLTQKEKDSLVYLLNSQQIAAPTLAIIKSELHKLTALTPWLSNEGTILTAIDIEALVSYYNHQVHVEQLKPRIQAHNALNTFVETWPHSYLKSKYAKLSYLDDPAIQPAIKNYFKQVASKKGLTPSQNWAYININEANLFACQAIVQENIYHLLGASPKAKQLRKLLRKQARKKKGLKRWEANITRDAFLDLFNPTLQSDLLTAAWKEEATLTNLFSSIPTLLGWGYYNDILSGIGKVPRVGAQNTYTEGANLSSHTRLILPAMPRSHYDMTRNLLYGLVFMGLDLTKIPQFGDGKSSPWYFHDTASHTVKTSPRVTPPAAHLNMPSTLVERLQKIVYHLSRSRIGWTPHEKYLFLSTYYKMYLLPLAYVFKSFPFHVLKDATLERITRFEVPKGHIDRELVRLLKEGPHKSFFPKGGLKDSNWQFDLTRQNQNLVVRFMDPMLEHLRVNDQAVPITEYQQLRVVINRIKSALHQRSQWCWNTPRHSMPVPGLDDQLLTPKKTSPMDLFAQKMGKKDDFSIQRRARKGSGTVPASPYHYPLKLLNNNVTESFPIDTNASSDPTRSAQERDMWLYLSCHFPKFISHYLEGYLQLAQNYQKAMQVFRYATQFFQHKHEATQYLTFLEGLPDRVVFAMDYANPDSESRSLSQFRYAVLPQEIQRYQREKGAYSGFDTVETLWAGAAKINYAATDYVKGLENFYFKQVKQSLHAGLIEGNLLSTQKLKDDPKAFFSRIHAWMNSRVSKIKAKDKRVRKFDFLCYQDKNIFAQHAIYQSKLSCSIQRQISLQAMLQLTLLSYRKSMDSFLNGLDLSQLPTKSAFTTLLTWGAKTFNSFMTDADSGHIAEKLAKYGQQDPTKNLFQSLAQKSPEVEMKEKDTEDIMWEEALYQTEAHPDPIASEVTKTKASIVLGFLSDLVPAVPTFLKNGSKEPTEVITAYMRQYPKIIASALGSSATDISQQVTEHGETKSISIPMRHWLFGPNILFEHNTPQLSFAQMITLQNTFKTYYKLYPLNDEKTLTGYSLNTLSEANSSNRRQAKLALLKRFNHKILDYSLSNIVNSKILLGPNHALGTQSSIRQSLNAHLGALGEDASLRRWYRGKIDTYGEVSPLGVTLFLYNRKSEFLQELQTISNDSSLASIPLLNILDVALTTNPGSHYELDPYAGRGKWWHLSIHKLFCTWGSRLRGGSLLMDPQHLRKPDNNLKEILLFDSLLGDSPFKFNFLNLRKPLPVTHAQVDPSKELAEKGMAEYVLAKWTPRESYEDFYCDPLSVNHDQPNVTPFDTSEISSLNWAQDRVSKAHIEMTKDPNFLKGAEELKKIQGSKTYESALLWTYLDLMNVYVLEPMMKSGMELQILFEQLDVTMQIFFGDYAGRKGKGASWVSQFYNKAVEGRFSEIYKDATESGLLEDFKARAHPDAYKPEENNRTYHVLMDRIKERLHLNFTKDTDDKPFSVVDGKVDVPGTLSGGSQMLHFLHGDEAHRFKHTDRLSALTGGDPKPAAYIKSSGDSCLAEDITIIEKSLLPEGKLNLRSFLSLTDISHGAAHPVLSETPNTLKIPENEVMSSILENAANSDKLLSRKQKYYLKRVEQLNTLKHYANWLDFESFSQAHIRPGFCKHKKLALMTAYNLLRKFHAIKLEDEELKNNETKACSRLVTTEVINGKTVKKPLDELNWALGESTAEELVNNDVNYKNHAYCNAIERSLKVAQAVRSAYGFGMDLPKPLEEPEIKYRDGRMIVEKKRRKQMDFANNLLVIYKDTTNSLYNLRQTFINSVALKHPLLDAEVAHDNAIKREFDGFMDDIGIQKDKSKKPLRSEAIGQILTGQSQERPFVKHAYVQIVKKHYPYGKQNPLDDLVDWFTKHPAPEEILETQVEPDKQEAILTQPNVIEKLTYDDQVLSSPLSSFHDAISTFAYTAWAEQGGESVTKIAKKHYLPSVLSRAKQTSAKLYAAFPWMTGTALAGGKLGPTLSNWLTYYSSQGPSDALYQTLSQAKHSGFVNALTSFLSDSDTQLGYTGILSTKIKTNLDVIKQTYNQTYQVTSVTDQDGPDKSTLETAKLDQLLAQRFSQPMLYEAVRRDVGPAFDKEYFTYVPTHVYREFKQYEQYQAVAGVISGTIFAVQIMLSITPFNFGLKPLINGAIRGGSFVGGKFALTRMVGAVAGFVMASYVGMVATSFIFGWLGYNFFKIFGADWQTIHTSFIALTGIAAIFMGLSKIRFVGAIFTWVKPILHWLLQMGWYFFIMDIVMYFGDRATLDASLLWYGWSKAMFDSYVTYKGLQLDPKSSIGRWMKQESYLLSSYTLEGQSMAKMPQTASTPHTQLFSEYDYLKHLHMTTQMALSYLWFGVMMASAMNYAQLRSVYRYKGLQPFPNSSHLSGLVSDGGIQGVRAQLRNAYMGMINQDVLIGPQVSRPQQFGALSEVASMQLKTHVMPDDMRFNWIITNIVKSAAFSTSPKSLLSKEFLTGTQWQNGAEVVKLSLRDTFNDLQIQKVLKQAIGDDYKAFIQGLNKEINGLHGTHFSEMFSDEVYKFGDLKKRKFITSALAHIEKEGHAGYFINTLMGSFQSSASINISKFAHMFSDFTARQHAIHRFIIDFNVYNPKTIAASHQLAKDLGRPPTETELHTHVSHAILRETRWTQVDDMLQHKLIRSIVQNHWGFTIWHHAIKPAAGAPFKLLGLLGKTAINSVVSIPQIPKILKKTWKASGIFAHQLSVTVKETSHSFVGDPLPDNYAHAIFGVEIANGLKAMDHGDYEGYLHSLIQDVPLHHEALEKAKNETNLLIPPHLQERLSKTLSDYKTVANFAHFDATKLNSGDLSDNIGSLRHLINLIAIRYFKPYEAKVLQASPAKLLELFSKDEKIQLVQELVYWGNDTLNLTKKDWSTLLKKVFAGHDVESYIDDAVGTPKYINIPKLFQNSPYPDVAIRNLMGHLLLRGLQSGSKKLKRYERLSHMKLQIVLLMNKLKGNKLVQSGHLYQLITLDDFSLLDEVGATHAYLEQLKTSETHYLTQHNGQLLHGNRYVTLTGDTTKIDAFLTKFDGDRHFGQAGPYFALSEIAPTHAEIVPARKGRKIPHNEPLDIGPETFLFNNSKTPMDIPRIPFGDR